MPVFDGFPSQTRAFLSDLAEHNEKPWFDAHRADYERWWLAPATVFVEAMGEELTRLAPDIRAEPKINGSIMPLVTRLSNGDEVEIIRSGVQVPPDR